MNKAHNMVWSTEQSWTLSRALVHGIVLRSIVWFGPQNWRGSRLRSLGRKDMKLMRTAYEADAGTESARERPRGAFGLKQQSQGNHGCDQLKLIGCLSVGWFWSVLTLCETYRESLRMWNFYFVRLNLRWGAFFFVLIARRTSGWPVYCGGTIMSQTGDNFLFQN